MPDHDVSLAFVCGCPRSGTTAMWRLLVSHQHVALGLERFSNLMWGEFGIEASLYERERFFDCRPGDTFYDDLVTFDPRYEQIQQRYGSAVLRGDKLPKLYLRLDDVAAAMPDARIVQIVRNVIDVAQSYDRRAQDESDTTWRRTQDHREAVKDWNESVAAAVAFHDAHPDRIMIIDYEHFFSAEGRLHPLLTFLHLEMTQEIATAYRSMVNQNADLERARRDGLPAAAKQHILLHADTASYRSVLERCTR